jgi:hypothetical protein
MISKKDMYRQNSVLAKTTDFREEFIRSKRVWIWLSVPAITGQEGRFCSVSTVETLSKSRKHARNLARQAKLIT